jgi:hypothetical protein
MKTVWNISKAVIWCSLVLHLAPRASQTAELHRAQNRRLVSIHQADFAVGLQHGQIRDDVLAPMRWSGFGGTIGFSYAYQQGNSRYEAEYLLRVVLPENRYGHKAVMWGSSLGLGYLHRLPTISPCGAFLIGGHLRWRLDEQYYYSWDESHIYWVNAYELGPTLRWHTKVPSRHRLALRLGIPVAALVSRPPVHRHYKMDRLAEPSLYITKPHENIRATSLHEYMAIDLLVDYTQTLRRRVTIGLSYQMNYAVHQEPEPLRLLTHTVYFKIIILSEKTRAEGQQ